MYAVLLLALLSPATASVCQFPSSLWCSSEEIAQQCKVYEACKTSEWTEPDVAAPQVQFELYYESLCPDCQRFISDQLYPTYEKVGNIMNLTLVPYGNAEEKKGPEGQYIFTCQHGELECIGNIIETCAIYELKNISIYFPFIHCMESSLTSHNPYEVASACANTTRVPVQGILSCANSSLGNTLEHQMALKTDALQPPHEYVPWVTLNGVHTEKINNKAVKNLLNLICKTYKGPKPEPCKEELQSSWKRCWSS